jgi:hypothetical protein
VLPLLSSPQRPVLHPHMLPQARHPPSGTPPDKPMHTTRIQYNLLYLPLLSYQQLLSKDIFIVGNFFTNYPFSKNMFYYFRILLLLQLFYFSSSKHVKHRAVFYFPPLIKTAKSVCISILSPLKC